MHLIDQRKFVEDALNDYHRLPEEGDSLYIRRFAPMGIDMEKYNSDRPDGKDERVKGFYDELHSRTGLNFDATVWEDGWAACHNPALSLAKFGGEEYGRALSGRLFRSGEDKYVALLHGTAKQALVIDVKDGMTADLKILFAVVGGPLPVQVFINLGKGARLNLFEWHASNCARPCFSGTIREVRLGDGATCEISVLHNENSNTAVLEHTRGTTGEGASSTINFVYTGGSAVRARNSLEASGRGSRVRVGELAVSSKKQKFDLNTYVVNAAGGSEARLSSAAVAMQESTCYLKGFARIINGARDARSFVEEKGLLVDGTAKINSIPSMAIGENAVKATHSSAMGPIDQDSMFYLTSRGVSPEAAKRLMVLGFFSGPISGIRSGLVKEVVSSVISGKIRSGGEFGELPALNAENVIWEGGQGAGIEQHYKYRAER